MKMAWRRLYTSTRGDHTRVARRSNLIFTSFTMGLFCCVVAEFSYWQYFGTYIWFVIIGLRPLGQFLCAIVEEQLQAVSYTHLTLPTKA